MKIHLPKHYSLSITLNRGKQQGNGPSVRVITLPKRTFERWIRDCFILYVEVPFMEMLGAKFHMRTRKEEPKSGWYIDGKFLCEEM